MLRRLALLSTLAPMLALAACTSTQNALLQKGDLCDDDIQCATPYICACVQTRPTGEDGADEVVAHGTCQMPGFKCKSDAGTDGALPDATPDTAPVDGGVDAPTDTTDAAAADTAGSDTTDAADSGADTTDAADASDGG